MSLLCTISLFIIAKYTLSAFGAQSQRQEEVLMIVNAFSNASLKVKKYFLFEGF